MFNKERDWYAIQVKARQEQLARDGLAARGVETILPCCKVKTRWSDRQKESIRPLFPGYLFASFDILNRLPILQTSGVTGIVTFGGIPEPVDTAEIEALYTLVKSETPAQIDQYLATGSRVHVVHGPMRGHDGYLVTRKGKHRLLLTLTLLKQAISVEVDENDVEPVEQPAQTAQHILQRRGLQLVMR